MAAKRDPKKQRVSKPAKWIEIPSTDPWDAILAKRGVAILDRKTMHAFVDRMGKLPAAEAHSLNTLLLMLMEQERWINIRLITWENNEKNRRAGRV